jgi:hypothetical protein
VLVEATRVLLDAAALAPGRPWRGLDVRRAGSLGSQCDQIIAAIRAISCLKKGIAQ